MHNGPNVNKKIALISIQFNCRGANNWSNFIGKLAVLLFGACKGGL